MKFADCKICGLTFEDHTPDHMNDAKVCPRCNDIRQKRDTIVLERDCLAQWQSVQIVSLPAAWQSFQGRKKDKLEWKIDFSGKQFGASWGGRIVIRAQQPFEVGDVVDIRLMTSKHQRGEFTETHEYIVFEKTEALEAQAKVEWNTAYSKTTLKGLGRHYRREIVYSADPLYKKFVNGGVRSGRAYTNGELSITHMDTMVGVREINLPSKSKLEISDEELLGVSALQKLRSRKLNFNEDEN